MPIFEVEGLAVAVNTARGWASAVRDVSFSLEPGEVLAIVGESASGKSLIAMGGLELFPPSVRRTAGTVELEGVDLGGLSDGDWRSQVGTRVGVIFQDPIAAHDPLVSIGRQSGEVLEEHFGLSAEDVRARVLDALGEVRLPARGRFSSFANEVSRGEAQRAMVAAALLARPQLLIADEPLTGLDVTVGRAVLDVIESLRHKNNMAMLLVTHDLAVVAGVADRVAVVYGGMIVEQGPVSEIFYRPRHPYTAGLLASMPALTGRRLRPIPGEAPDITDLPTGCPFAPRCEHVIDRCSDAVPSLDVHGPSLVRCIRAAELSLPGVGR